MILAAGWTMALSQSDTLVLNQTEFRFPETHPGEVFLVQKVMIAPKGSLNKTGAAEAEAELSDDASAANRDLRGRLETSSYQERLARIQRKHGLPTLSARQSEEKPFKVPKRFQMPKGSRFGVTSNSPRIKSGNDLAALEKAEREAVRRKYGALSPEFSRQVKAMKEDDEMDVSIELAVKGPGYINGMKATKEEQIANAKAWVSAKPVIQAPDLVRRYGLKRLNAQEGLEEKQRSLEVRASRNQIQQLAHVEGVVSIVKKLPIATASVPGSSEYGYEKLINSAYNPPGEMTNYGGIDVATVESGIADSYVDCLPSDLKPVEYGVGSEVHAQATYHLLALGTPDNNRYHFFAYNFEGAGTSIVNNNIRSISTSWIRPWDGETQQDSRWVDNMAYLYPYPTFSLAAGNGRSWDPHPDSAFAPGAYGYDSVPISRTYNSLIVGNVQHYDNAHYTMETKVVTSWSGGNPVVSIWSETKNPPAKYGYAGDWELPSLVAPGYVPDPWWGFYEGCLTTETHRGPGIGTSLSAPVAAAMAANVAAARGGYPGPTRWGTEIRNILMLTAQDVDEQYWHWGSEGSDSKDGAGTVSGTNAVKFVETREDVSPNNYPALQGMGSDYIDSATFVNSPTDQTYYYHVPSSLPEGKHLRVVLNWTSSPSLTVAENEVSDLALYVESENVWYQSNTFDSNVEIVDVDNGDLTPNDNYAIVVSPGVYRQATGGPNLLYYTVAWTWVKNQAD
jgi:hypothetical protein